MESTRDASTHCAARIGGRASVSSTGDAGDAFLGRNSPARATFPSRIRAMLAGEVPNEKAKLRVLSHRAANGGSGARFAYRPFLLCF